MAVQLFGDKPELMARAAEIALPYSPDVIDLNMGCPAPKVTSNGGGCALMKNPALAGEIIKRVVRAVPVPVSVKIRKGWSVDSVNAVEIAKIAEKNGAAAITVHARTRDQMYSPPADLDIITAVKAAVKIPVIGNGDVASPYDAKNMLDITGCDLVMVGRGALGAPWIFKRIENFLETGADLGEPGPEERMSVMLRHIRLLCEFAGEERGMREARKHAAWYMRGFRGAASLRREAGKLRAYGDIERLAQEALSRNKNG